MRRIVLAVFTIAALIATTSRGSAQTAEQPCHGKQQIRKVAELLFGRDIGHHLAVSNSGWIRFVARELTPRFPDGLTVSDALGQWRDRRSGGIVREPSKRVEIVLPGAVDDDAKLDAVIAAYKRAFHQQSVGIIVRTACVAF